MSKDITAPRMAERSVEEIFTALDEQTVAVPGTDAAALVAPSLGRPLGRSVSLHRGLRRRGDRPGQRPGLPPVAGGRRVPRTGPVMVVRSFGCVGREVGAAADAADLLTSPDATRLTACASPPCNRFLLKHGRRQWCSTRCGDRARAARAYARRTATE